MSHGLAFLYVHTEPVPHIFLYFSCSRLLYLLFYDDNVRFHWFSSLLLLLFFFLSAGYHAPLDLYPEFHRIAKDPTLHSVPEGRPVSVCVGKEWYRFPSSFLLPHKSVSCSGSVLTALHFLRADSQIHLAILFPAGSCTSFSPSLKGSFLSLLLRDLCPRRSSRLIWMTRIWRSQPDMWVTDTWHCWWQPGTHHLIGFAHFYVFLNSFCICFLDENGPIFSSSRWIYASATIWWTWTQKKRRHWSLATQPARKSGTSSPISLSFTHQSRKTLTLHLNASTFKFYSGKLFLHRAWLCSEFTVFSARSHPLLRAFYIPFLSDHHTTYRRYVILKPRRQKQPRKRTHGWPLTAAWYWVQNQQRSITSVQLVFMCGWSFNKCVVCMRFEAVASWSV